jgi:polyribonucleotide nucleotidyltransferase
MPEKVIIPVGDQEIIIETGKYAKQADGSVTVQLGETVILVAAVAASKAKPGQDFFPLTVDYREKAAAAGKFPGGYFKREGRPTEKEILTCRLTDRPIRPLFPKGWYNEVQVQSVLLSADGQNDPDILSILGASAALTVSDIPWDGPLGAVRIGRVAGQFVVNPTHAQQSDSDLDLIYVGNKTDVVMYEGAANEISEEDFIAALKFAQEACQPQIAAQEELRAKAGKTKRAITVNIVPEEILAEAKALAGDRIIPALLVPQKLAREAAVNAVFADVGEKLKLKFGAEKVTDYVLKDAQYYIQKETVRLLILDSGKRLDGRATGEIRPISSEVGFLPRAHGSSVFCRGETQAVCLATLGTSDDIQEFDSYTGGETKKQFLLHYNFPNFSVGETGRISGPGRREIGHGALAERSVAPVIPLKEYPYAIRITAEIMESNGSTSMASVCGATLALMDAGVPLIRPVAGISIGICTEYGTDHQISRYSLLTDIIGWEDAFCDMDCKIAGTEKGITGFQLDLKLRGLPLPIMAEAVEAARVARLSILGDMAKTLSAPRTDISKYAPRITVIRINPEKIGLLIGPGGKNIKRIVDESGCEINIEDDGTVKVFSVTPEGMEIARREIEALGAEIEIGKTYKGRVVTIKEFGAFVEVFPGQDGLVHVSELSNRRVNRPEDVVKMGDEVWVKCIGVDDKGRVKLSRKAAMEERGEAAAVQTETAGTPRPERPERPERSERPERTERPERPERGDRFERPAREERSERPERAERPVREDRGPERVERPVRDDRGSDRPERPVRDDRGADRVERAERPVRDDRVERPLRDDRAPRGERAERPDRGPREDRPERPVRDDRGERSERVSRDDRSERPVRDDRGERVERPVRDDRGERPVRDDRGERAERPVRDDRGERAERPVRDDRGERSERAPRDDRGDRGVRDERVERPVRDDRGERPVRDDRGERPVRDDRGERPVRGDRGERAPRVERVERVDDRFERPAPAADDRGERPVDRGDRPARGERSDRYDRGERSERPPERGERSERPERGGGRERAVDRGGDRGRRPAAEDGADGLETGKLYRAKVASIKDFGAFVEFIPGREGLVHVSELANFRVKQVEDIVQIGDEIWVKLLGVDDKGRVRLSRRAAMEEREKAENGDVGRAPEPAPAPEDDRFLD